MDIETLKKEIEDRTGVPANLLNGTTAAENISIAKQILGFKIENEEHKPKSTREQFAEVITAAEPAADPRMIELKNIENEEMKNTFGPIVKDAGEVQKVLGDPRPNWEQFDEFMKSKLTKGAEAW